MKNLIILSISLAASITFSHSQCRPATDTERQAYEQLVQALSKELSTKTPEGNWRVFREVNSVGKLQVTEEYGKTIICTDRYDVSLERTEAAQSRQAKLDTLKPSTQTERSFYVARDTIYQDNPAAAGIGTSDRYSINVEMNASNYRLQSPTDMRFVQSYQPIAVTGAAQAFEITLKPEYATTPPRQEVVVLLGTWDKKEITNAEGEKRYRAAFKKGGKLTENLIVTITAPLEIGRAVAQRVDWQSINAALLK